MSSSTGSSIRDSLAASCVGALALVGVAVMAGGVHAVVSPIMLRADWSALHRPADATGTDAAALRDAPIQDKGPLISLEQAYELFVSGAVFIDSRREVEYNENHVLGAVHLESEMITSGRAGSTLDQLLSYGTDQALVIYCYGGDCDSAENTAMQLIKLGFTNIRIMHASFDEWRKAGYETEADE